MTRYRSYTIGRTNPLVALLMFFGIMLLMFWVARGIFSILSALFPIMLIITAFLNYRVVLGYISWLTGLIKSNVALGIVAVIFSIMAHPLVGAYLLYRAIQTRGQKDEAERSVPGEYIQYEEVEDDFLDLSDVKKKEKEIRNQYEDLL